MTVVSFCGEEFLWNSDWIGGLVLVADAGGWRRGAADGHRPTLQRGGSRRSQTDATARGQQTVIDRRYSGVQQTVIDGRYSGGQQTVADRRYSGCLLRDEVADRA